ncbi:hypothetical protein DO70_4692 [Burkholderia pseudomallei]|nr:hypothetical protein DO70_4692 [Burkholderia pseudomallei]
MPRMPPQPERRRRRMAQRIALRELELFDGHVHANRRAREHPPVHVVRQRGEPANRRHQARQRRLACRALRDAVGQRRQRADDAAAVPRHEAERAAIERRQRHAQIERGERLSGVGAVAPAIALRQRLERIDDRVQIDERVSVEQRHDPIVALHFLEHPVRVCIG